ncbi:hypothetical protein FMUND_11969 [Fusarium mundagurra]|uniref:BZIP domain-containing protein n=1 Tax=Fusarium mundagurra TaxID=1567541 RepID=A0A8H5Y4X0_9HYPO|nr:hypothetical protein FMUND_11969 [Fusarium mundagurra]
MDEFSSGFVGQTWLYPSGYPAYPIPSDTQFGFDTLDLTNTLAGDPNNLIQPGYGFFQGWLDGSGVVQTEQVASQKPTALLYPEYDIMNQPRPAQENHSWAVSNGQLLSTQNLVFEGRKDANLRPSNTVTSTKENHVGHMQDFTQDGTPQVRERNHYISRRYRDRKQQEAETLEASWERLQEQNAALKTYYNDLRTEVLGLQDLLLQHTGCNCSMIHAFIAAQAERSLHNLISPSA